MSNSPDLYTFIDGLQTFNIEIYNHLIYAILVNYIPVSNIYLILKHIHRNDIQKIKLIKQSINRVHNNLYNSYDKQKLPLKFIIYLLTDCDVAIYENLQQKELLLNSIQQIITYRQLLYSTNNIV